MESHGKSWNLKNSKEYEPCCKLVVLLSSKYNGGKMTRRINYTHADDYI